MNGKEESYGCKADYINHLMKGAQVISRYSPFQNMCHLTISFFSPGKVKNEIVKEKSIAIRGELEKFPSLRRRLEFPFRCFYENLYVDFQKGFLLSELVGHIFSFLDVNFWDQTVWDESCENNNLYCFMRSLVIGLKKYPIDKYCCCSFQ